MNESTKKVLNIVVKVVTGILIAFTVFIMLFTIVTVSTVNKNERTLFGHRFYIVRSPSMSLSEENAHMDVHIDPGDIVIAKVVNDPSALDEGDIITFISFNEETYGEPVTHMIRCRNYGEDGKFLGYTTFGTNTNNNDLVMVEARYVLGTYAGKLPQVGYFFMYLKTTPGYITCILVPFALLILYNGVNIIRLFRQYKREQTAAMEEEKAQIAEERKQTEQMLRELQALKEQLGLQANGSVSPVTAVPTENTHDENKPDEPMADDGADAKEADTIEPTSDNA